MTAPMTPERLAEMRAQMRRLEAQWNDERTRRLVAEAERDRLRAQVAAVAAVHHPITSVAYGVEHPPESGFCEADGFAWPCPTYAALGSVDEVQPTPTTAHQARDVPGWLPGDEVQS